jgi:hypothetical protein
MVADISEVVRHLRGPYAGVIRYEQGAVAQGSAAIQEAGIVIRKAAVEEEQIDGAAYFSNYFAGIAVKLPNKFRDAGSLEITACLRGALGILFKRKQPSPAQFTQNIRDPQSRITNSCTNFNHQLRLSFAHEFGQEMGLLWPKHGDGSAPALRVYFSHNIWKIHKFRSAV